MSRAPLRFLIFVLAGWVGIRAAILMPDWAGEMAPVPIAVAAPVPVREMAQPPSPEAPPDPKPIAAVSTGVQPDRLARIQVAAVAPIITRQPQALPVAPPLRAEASAPRPALAVTSFPPLAPWPVRPTTQGWTASAWLLVRGEGDASLAPGGTLGGSQAGGRLTYSIGGRFALSGRIYVPLRRPAGAEAALGVDWRPVRAVPINLLAERRQRLGREGRNAFALTAYGGVSHALTPRVRLDVYGQAGVVGLRSRDLFADGSARLSRRVGPVEVGAGAWGAAQLGATRLDVGPSLSWRLPVSAANLRLQADWRFRVGGEAAPRSGPALTLAVDF